MKLHRLRSSSKHKILFVAAAAFAVCSIAFALPHTHATLGPSATDILSANKGLLLYSSGSGNNFAVGALESSATSSLVSDFGNSVAIKGDRWLHLSPDGKLLSVTINPLGTDSPPLTYISDANGTPLTKSYSGDFVSWAPDSSKVLLYVSPTEAPWERKIYALDTNNSYADTRLPDGTIDAVISPVDGSIAYSFTSGGTDNSTIYVRDPQGNDKVLLKGSNQILAWLRWSPKGDKLAFLTSDLYISQGQQSLSLMNPDGTGQEQISGIGWNYPPVWSPDGTRIAFANEGNIWEYDTSAKSLKNVSNLQNAGASHPSYGGDGSTIVFSANVGGESQIWATQGGNVVKLTAGSQQKDYPILP
jgi:Tol biopolymer transport system component